MAVEQTIMNHEKYTELYTHFEGDINDKFLAISYVNNVEITKETLPFYLSLLNRYLDGKGFNDMKDEMLYAYKHCDNVYKMMVTTNYFGDIEQFTINDSEKDLEESNKMIANHPNVFNRLFAGS
jgi:hypothetical protein